jgi:hypothetical protein
MALARWCDRRLGRLRVLCLLQCLLLSVLGCGSSSPAGDGSRSTDDAGQETAAADAIDVAPDGHLAADSALPECTSDSDCPPQKCLGRKCLQGQCIFDAALGLGAACTTECGPGVCDGRMQCLPTACDDGKPCTLDTCPTNSGVCVHKVGAGYCGCASSADCQTGSKCLASRCLMGECVHHNDNKKCPIQFGGEGCADSDNCTLNLQEGEYACANLDLLHCTDTCAADQDCDDTNPCTADKCTGGWCEHSTVAACAIPCSSTGTCDDDNSCTTDSCTGGHCVNTAIVNCCLAPGSCLDNNLCTLDFCRAADHQCVSVAVPCVDDKACTSDGCDPASGACQFTVLPSCSTGACGSATPCDDGNPCTCDACTAAGACVFTAIPNCAYCTTAGCSDDNPCTVDLCDWTGQCQHVGLAGCLTTPCLAYGKCKGMTKCIAGECEALDSNNWPGAWCDLNSCTPCNSAKTCDDADAGTVDSCQWGWCVHTALAKCP